jgi:hypothetical protein
MTRRLRGAAKTAVRPHRSSFITCAPTVVYRRSTSPRGSCPRLPTICHSRALGPERARGPYAIIENWRASTVITIQPGYRFTPQLAVNSLNNGGYQLPDRVANGSLPSSQRSYRHWFNTSLDPLDPARAFAIPALYQHGNSSFDIRRGPGLASADAALGRRFSVGERLRLQTTLDVFNLLNQTNFALPNPSLGVESAGVISHTSTSARQLEVPARVEW